MSTSNRGILIVGHPRGMTTMLFDLLRRATRLAPPERFVNKGEVLNMHCNKLWKFRHFSRCDDSKIAAKFVLEGYAAGRIVKDVVQPECVEYFLANCRVRPHVVYAERDLEETRICQMLRGWSNLPDPAKWDERIRNLASDRITYKELTTDPSCIERLVRRLGMTAAPVSWLTDEFEQKTRETERKIQEFRRK